MCKQFRIIIPDNNDTDLIKLYGTEGQVFWTMWINIDPLINIKGYFNYYFPEQQQDLHWKLEFDSI